MPDAPAVEKHVPRVPVAGDLVVHPVERAQQRGLARSGRADESGDRAAPDLDVDIAQDGLLAEAECQVDGSQRDPVSGDRAVALNRLPGDGLTFGLR